MKYSGATYYDKSLAQLHPKKFRNSKYKRHAGSHRPRFIFSIYLGDLVFFTPVKSYLSRPLVVTSCTAAITCTCITLHSAGHAEFFSGAAGVVGAARKNIHFF